jgi:isocitrate dehydrogenase (NAD+)
VANPSALMLAAALMLEHLGEDALGSRVRRAIIATIVADEVRTRDLGGTASTQEFGDAVARRVG